MRIVRHLGRLQRVARRRLLVLKALAPPIWSPSGPDRDRYVSFVVIEVANLWSQFCRCYFISCALRAKRVTGVRVMTAMSLTTKNDVITFAVKYNRPNRTGTGPWSWRDEPAWQKPTTVLNLLQQLGASNLSQAQVAFSHSTTVFQHLPTMRNFFAHRSEATATQLHSVARSVRGPTGLKASDVLCLPRPKGTESILREWIEDLCHIVDNLCQ